MIAQVTAIALVLLPTAALAQQTRETFKDANGRTLGWSTSNGNGGISFYDHRSQHRTRGHRQQRFDHVLRRNRSQHWPLDHRQPRHDDVLRRERTPCRHHQANGQMT